MSNTYVGTWRIIEMEQWDQDFIDLVVPGYIAFREDHLGGCPRNKLLGLSGQSCRTEDVR